MATLKLRAGPDPTAMVSRMALDQMALQQQINADFLLHAITNYKKAPFERKTLEFIARRRRALQQMWRDFRRLDKQIRRVYKDIEPQHGYFRQELFELVEEKYEAARGRLLRDKRNLLKCKLCAGSGGEAQGSSAGKGEEQDCESASCAI